MRKRPATALPKQRSRRRQQTQALDEDHQDFTQTEVVNMIEEKIQAEPSGDMQTTLRRYPAWRSRIKICLLCGELSLFGRRDQTGLGVLWSGGYAWNAYALHPFKHWGKNAPVVSVPSGYRCKYCGDAYTQMTPFARAQGVKYIKSHRQVHSKFCAIRDAVVGAYARKCASLDGVSQNMPDCSRRVEPFCLVQS